MNRAQYNRARAAILTIEGQASHAAYIAGYSQRPEVIEGLARMRRDDQRRDIRTVCEAVARFTAEHPILAERHHIGIDGTWAEISAALYDCYVQSGRGVGALVGGHGSFITDVDPHGIQAAWIAAARLAKG